MTQKNIFNFVSYNLNKITLLLIIFFSVSSCHKYDAKQGWPTYRYNTARTAVTHEMLPQQMELKWTSIPVHSPEPVWDLPAEEMKRTHSDDTYYVSAANGMAYYGSSVDNKVYALNILNGKEKWVFYTEGPVRFSPSIWNKRVYFGSDDGFVYCLNAKNGKLIWKYKPGPKDKKIIGSGRMVSPWPVRTSVLVKDEIVYFGAGVFPYDGLYICALDAKNGSVIWKNDDLDDDVFDLRYGGVSPQGYLIASETKLLVPSGRAMPAVFDRNNGKFLYYLSPSGKHGGTWGMVDNGELIAGIDRSGKPVKVAYDLESGSLIGDVYASFTGIDMAVTDSVSYVIAENGVYAIDRHTYPVIQQKIDSVRLAQDDVLKNLIPRAWKAEVSDKTRFLDLLNEMTGKLNLMMEEEKDLQAQSSKWFFPGEQLSSVILTGNQVIAGGKDIVIGLDKETGEKLWHSEVEGFANSLSVSNQSLIVSTDKGNIYCFREGTIQDKNNKPVVIQRVLSASAYKDSKKSTVISSTIETILNETGVNKGYCLVLNCGNGELVYELAAKSDLHIIGIDISPKKVKKAKKLLDEAGLYGSRVVVENWSINSLPDYFADLIISGENIETGKMTYTAEEIYRVLRPAGGIVCLSSSGIKDNSSGDSRIKKIPDGWETFEIGEPEIINNNGSWIKITRMPLAGAGGWTHQYGDPANTSCSDDQLVKAPFSTLWYGSPGPLLIPERHARATAPVAFEGKLILQGEDIIMAYNAYNGVLLWEREIEGVTRVRVDADGGNMAINNYGLFIAVEDKCLQLDIETGELLKTYYLPEEWKGKPRRWGYLAVKGNILFGSPAEPLKQDYAQLLGNIFDEDEHLREKDEMNPLDALVAEYYKYRGFENLEDVDHAFQRDGTKWRSITDFPQWSPGVAGLNPVSERMMTSDGIFAFNIESGDLLWTHKGDKIAQITISVGNESVYFAETEVNYTQRQKAWNEKKQKIQKGNWEKFNTDLGFNEADVRMVYSLDILTGEKNWERPIDLSGCGDDYTATGYQNGVLVFFGSYGLHDKWRFPAGQLKWHRITAVSAEDGEMMWSRPLNYMVRPLLVKDEIIIEPRKCNLYTGEIVTRIHPVTGQEVPWEFYRPGHTCAATSANDHCLFYRSYNGAYYDLKEDKGLTYYGAVRPGCWINMIPGNGLVLFPEASSGCTCSFPIRTSVVLKPENPEEVEEWSLYISNAPVTPVKHLAINLGAPGDRKDNTGNIWFGYPRPDVFSKGVTNSQRISVGIKISLNENIKEGMGFYSYDSKGVHMEGTEYPWLFTNGCVGLQSCNIPLIDDVFGEKAGVYTVRLGFTAPAKRSPFDIKIQGETVLTNVDIMKEAGAANRPVIKEFNGIGVADTVRLELVTETKNSGTKQSQAINFIEIIREDPLEVKDRSEDIKNLDSSEAEKLIVQGQENLKNKNIEEALHKYHQVLNGSDVKEHKIKALQGMETIASIKSLPEIKIYCQNPDPIIWNYKEPDKDVVDAALKVLNAIANNLKDQDKVLAEKMLIRSQLLTEKTSGS